MTRCCRYHCAACRAHFSSLNAFDAHRRNDGAEHYCTEPMDDARFAAVSEDGRCEVYSEIRHGVTIWTLGNDLQRARLRSGGAPRKPSTARHLGRDRRAAA